MGAEAEAGKDCPGGRLKGRQDDMGLGLEESLALLKGQQGSPGGSATRESRAFWLVWRTLLCKQRSCCVDLGPGGLEGGEQKGSDTGRRGTHGTAEGPPVAEPRYPLVQQGRGRWGVFRDGGRPEVHAGEGGSAPAWRHWHLHTKTWTEGDRMPLLCMSAREPPQFGLCIHKTRSLLGGYSE